MTDPWYIGAQKYREERGAAGRAVPPEMEEAVTVAVPQLARFLEERGVAAQALLDAASPGSGPGSNILFGVEGGDEFFRVYLDRDGLQYEGVYRTRLSQRSSSPREAVLAFAYSGPGINNPQRVRDIVGWLTERIDEYLPN